MGAIYGNLRRHPSDIGNEGAIREEKRNHRKTLWKCKGESWFSIYADVRKNPDGNEGRVYICVYEFEKVSKDKGKMGIAGEKKPHKISILNTICLIKEKWLWNINIRATLFIV